MPGASLSHVLIVAGASGAGKSAFLSELAAGRLQDDIHALLPSSAGSWREILNNKPEHWDWLLAQDQPAPKLPGIAVHYDITLQWLKRNGELHRDPFWKILERSEAVTLINIKPSRQRLLRQWLHTHFGVRSLSMAHCRKAAAICASHLRSTLRQHCTRVVHRTGERRYGKRLRFLKIVDRALEPRLKPWQIASFDFYCKPESLETMHESWDVATSALFATLPATRIDLVPHDRSEIGKNFRWEVAAVTPAPAGRPARPPAAR